MTTHTSQQNGQNTDGTGAVKGEAAMPTQPSASQPIVLSKEPERMAEDLFYFEDDEPSDLVGTPLVTPFQVSNAMPTVSTQAQSHGQKTDSAAGATPAQKSSRPPQLSLKLVAIFVSVIVIGGMLLLSALAQITPPLQTKASAETTQQQPTTPPQPGRNQQNTSQPATKSPPSGGNKAKQTTTPSSEWVPQQLPDGWTDAGLLMGDGIQALRTAVAFNDREMSLDYRSVGTRNNHRGTFTAAIFIMTAAARQRFQQNDVRAINNTLFDEVTHTKLVRLVVNPQPRLAKFAQAGQQQFAWVDVAFQLWQSQIDPKNRGQRMEGKDLDPASNQPRIHHMIVLLLHIPSQNAGNNPAMGGTGWLVSTYALDPAHEALPAIVQPA